mgnify:CR=1 FL=1
MKRAPVQNSPHQSLFTQKNASVPVWKRIFSGLFWVNFSTALSGVLGLFLFSRAMPVSEFGQYILAQTIQLLSQWLFFGWAIYGGLCFASKYAEDQRLSLLVTRVIVVFSLIGILLVGVVFFAIEFLPPGVQEHQALVKAIVIAVSLRAMALFILDIHRGLLDYQRYTRLESLQTILSPLLGYLCIVYLQGDAEGAFWGITVSNLLLLLLDGPWILRHVQFRASKKEQILGQLFRFGSPISATVLLNQCAASFDRIILAVLLGESSVATYGAAVMLAERPLNVIFNWTGSASASLGFNAMNQGRRKNVRDVMEHSAKTLAILTWPMAFGLIKTASITSTLIVGPQLSEAVAKIIPYVVLAALGKAYLEHFFDQFFQFLEQTNRLFLLRAIAMVISSVASLMLIPLVGLIGPCLGALISSIFSLCIQIPYVLANFRLRVPWRDLSLILLACLWMVAVLELFQQQETLLGMVLLIFIGAVSYSLAILGLGLFDLRLLCDRERPVR